MKKRMYFCVVCHKRESFSKGSLCPHCACVVKEMLQNETREMVKEIAATTESVIQNLEHGVVHYDSETSKVLTDPVDIVTAIMEDRIIFHPQMKEFLKEYPHLVYEV